MPRTAEQILYTFEGDCGWDDPSRLSIALSFIQAEIMRDPAVGARFEAHVQEQHDLEEGAEEGEDAFLEGEVPEP